MPDQPVPELLRKKIFLALVNAQDHDMPANNRTLVFEATP